MPEENDSKNSVGYGKPPKHTRFRPGQSGNPRGRPRKSATFEDEIERELNSTIIVSEDGERRRISKRRAIVKKQVVLALSGNLRAAELVLSSSRQVSSNHDSLGLLLEEFREKNLRLRTDGTNENTSPDLAETKSLDAVEEDKS
jgi:hypothetical protein